jgi:ubiquinone/menaquinone biosynthesis C-methylase UbiE
MDAENSVLRRRKATAGFFDRLARDGGALLFTPADEPKLEHLRLRLGHLRGLRVLEPGCGAGTLTERLAGWVEPGGSVDAFDPSGEMIARCRHAVANRSNVRVRRAFCEEAVFPDGAFDRIVCFRVFPHFHDVDAVLGRFARWLRPAGQLHIVHWASRAALATVHGAHSAVIADTLPSSADLTLALAQHGFTVTSLFDDAAEFYLEARRR